MRTSQIFLFALLGCTSAWAQTNTFPTTGDVGIGTTTPTAKLHVVGQDARFFSNTGANTLEMGRTTNEKILLKAEDNHFFFDWIQDADENGPHIMYFRNLAQGTSPSNDIRFQTSSVDRLTIKANGNVGIGTSNPSASLEINNPDSSIIVHTDESHQPFITLGMGQTDRWSLGSYEATNGLYERTFFIYEDHTGANGSKGVRLAIKPNGNVGIGTVDPGTYKLAVNGNVRAKEIKVETGWSDFVFESDYQLPTLEEVENHINEKGHLKDIPSAEEVAENGILLGEMDSKLLQKIEELTLYTIAQEKRIKHLEKENQTLRSITERMAKIEALLKAE